MPQRSIDLVRCLLGCALGLAVSVPAAFLGPLAVLAGPMGRDLGWTRSALFVAVTISTVGLVLLSPYVGRLLDRYGARPLAIASAVLLPATVALEGLIPPSYTAFIAVAVLLAIVSGVSHITVCVSVVARWFDRSLGLAIGIALAGLGLGQAMTSMLAQRLLEDWGWRGAWLGIAATMAVMGLAAILIVPWRTTPALLPRSADSERLIARVWPTLLRLPFFWVCAGALLTIMTVSAGVVLNVVEAMRDRGLPGLTAASIGATVPLAAIAGRLITGSLIYRYSYVWVGAVMFVGQAIGCILLATTDALPLTYLAVTLIGIGYGADSDLLPYIIKRRFGVTVFGSIFGLMSGVVLIGVMLGPLLTAMIFEQLGSYRPAFLLFAGAGVLAAAMWILASRLPSPALDAATERPSAS